MTTQFTDDVIAKGAQFIESVRTLDERRGLKVALALAGISPNLFTQLLSVVRSQETTPSSTLELNPPGLTPPGLKVVPK